MGLQFVGTSQRLNDFNRVSSCRVHSMSTFQQITYQEAHDTEILAIDFTDPGDKESPYLVATAGRDRLLHVFDVVNDYALVQTLDDHSSSITCIRFTADGSRMMSCGADKSIVFRNCQKVMVQAIPRRHLIVSCQRITHEATRSPRCTLERRWDDIPSIPSSPRPRNFL